MTETKLDPQLEPIAAALRAARTDTDYTVEQLRDMTDAGEPFLAVGAPEPAAEVRVDAGGVPSILRVPDETEGGAVLVYLHGGGFVSGSADNYRSLTSRIAAATKMPTLVVDYRLAPENPFPAPVEDSAAAISWAASQPDALGEFEYDRIVVAGDSAGGNLTITSMLHLREVDPEALGTIAGALTLSGWFDLRNDTPSYGDYGEVDPILGKSVLDQMRSWYMQGADHGDWLASPSRADVAGLPPIRLDVGQVEVLRDDTLEMAAQLESAGVEVEVEVWPGMIHIFQVFAGHVDAAREAIDRGAGWLRRQAGLGG